MTEATKIILRDAKQFARPAKERTLFSLGGRGHYENPASDLLAFFLEPDGEHGLGGLFLNAFIKCIKDIDESKYSYAGAKVTRERRTSSASRIDLVVEGPDWVLLIENKIYSSPGNPFDTYKKYGEDLVKVLASQHENPLLLAILSPVGESAVPNWVGVSYKNFCNELRDALSGSFLESGCSKWLVFAREFILHLENELYQPEHVMTDEQARFVEANAEGIAEVIKMAADYRKFLRDLVLNRLSASGSGSDFRVKDEGWALRCYCDSWHGSNLALYSDAWKNPSFDKGFRITVYLTSLDEEQLRRAQKTLHVSPEGASWWTWSSPSASMQREEGIAKLCEVAALVTVLYPPERTEPRLATHSPL
jgi:PD-(D/E)XK nuclease superfamily